MKTSLLFFAIMCMLGCTQHHPRRSVLKIDPALQESFSTVPVRIEPNRALGPFVGKRVELVGIVCPSGTPQIQGVDVRGLERFRGERVLVSGVLRRATDEGGAPYWLQYLAYGYCK